MNGSEELDTIQAVADEVYKVLISKAKTLGIDLEGDDDAEGDWNEFIDDFLARRMDEEVEFWNN